MPRLCPKKAVLVILAGALLAGAAAAQPTPQERRELEAAVRTLQQKLQRDPDHQQLVYELARKLSMLGRHAEADRHFARLLAVYPDNADYLLGQGLNFLWWNRPARALAPLQRARQLAPGYAEVQTALAQAQAATGKDGEARASEAAPPAR